MSTFRAFHLPDLPAFEAPPLTASRGPHRTVLSHAELSPDDIETQARQLLATGDELRGARSTGEMIGLVDTVARRFLDPGDTLRAEAIERLPAVTGYTPEMVGAILDGMAREWTADSLRGLLATDLPDPAMLDGFRPRRGAGGRSRAYPPRLVTHVFSGNVPGVAVTSLVRALLLRAPSLGKTAAGEPVLPVLFARAVAEADPLAGRALAVAWWPGSDRTRLQAAVRHAEAVVAYGGTDAVAAVREATPAHARFLGYGHRVSFGIVTREALAGDPEGAARAAAADVSLFDQQGCVSPHLFYVEAGGDVDSAAWTELLADALADQETRLPRGDIDPGEAARIREARAEAEFTALAGSGGAVHSSDPGTAWTVVHDPDPAFTASCLNRVVRVKPFASPDELRENVSPLRYLLQTVGIAASEGRTREMAGWLGALGASRITPLGRMAWPPGSWHHDGRPPLGDLVRWCDVEA